MERNKHLKEIRAPELWKAQRTDNLKGFKYSK